MNINQKINTISTRQSFVIPYVFTTFVIISLIFLAVINHDVASALYTQISVLSGLLIFIVLMMNPFFALILIIIFTELANLVPLPVIGSITKIIGIPVAIGWFLKYFISKKTNLFKFMEFNKYLIVFIILMVCSSLLAIDPAISISSVVKYTLSIFMVFFIQDLIDSRKRLNIFIVAIASSVGMSSIIGLIQYVIYQKSTTIFGNVHIGAESMIRIGGFGGANAFGVFLSSGLPFILFLAFNAKRAYVKLLFSSLFLTTLTCIGLTISRTAIFGSVAVLLFYFFLNLKDLVRNKKQLLIWILFIVLIALLTSFFLVDIIMQRDVSLQDTSSSERYNVFLKSIYLLMKNPFFGIGFNNISVMQNPTGIYTEIGRAGHDIFSVLFVSIGLIGSTVFLFFCYKTLRYYYIARKYLSREKEKYLSSLIIALMAGFLSFSVISSGESPTNTRIFWIHLALAAVFYNRFVSDNYLSNR